MPNAGNVLMLSSYFKPYFKHLNNINLLNRLLKMFTYPKLESNFTIIFRTRVDGCFTLGNKYEIKRT